MTQIINLFGGPCCGKSSIAAGLFAEFKKNHINCELVTEIAKDLTWEERKLALSVQPFVFGLQLIALEKLINKVDFIITDSPIWLSKIYCNAKYKDIFNVLVDEIFHSFSNINFLLKRNTDNYSDIGRNQNLEQAIDIDKKILCELNINIIKYTIINVDKNSINNIINELKFNLYAI